MCKLRRIKEINAIYERFPSLLTKSVNKYLSENPVHDVKVTEDNGYTAILITYEED